MKKWFALLLAVSLTAACALAEGGLTDFQTYDINIQPGEVTELIPVSQDIFAAYDLTMVNLSLIHISEPTRPY